MHLVITLIIDQSWIKARKDTKEATCSRAIVSSSNLKKIKFTKCRQARPTGFGVLRRPPPYRCYPVDGLRLGLRVLIRLIFICWHRCPVQPAPRPRLSVTVGLRVGLSDHRVPESDSGSAHWHTAAAMTVPQCGMGRGLTTDERAGTDTLSEASWLGWLAFHCDWHKSPWRSYASRGRRRGADSDSWPWPLLSCCGGLLWCQCRGCSQPEFETRNLNLKVYY